MYRRESRLRWPAVVATLALLAAACGEDTEPAGTTAAPVTAAPTTAAPSAEAPATTEAGDAPTTTAAPAETPTTSEPPPPPDDPPTTTTEPGTEIRRGGSLDTFTYGDPGGFDLHLIYSRSGHFAVPVFNNLVTFSLLEADASVDSLVGDLATSWSVSEDGLEYTFTLVEGVTWHDGEAFDADDVTYSITKMADPDRSALASTFAAVAGVEKVDSYTVRVTLSAPFAQFPPAARGAVRRHAGGASGGNGRHVHRLPGRDRSLDLQQLPGGREPRVRTQPELLQGRAAVHRHLHPVHPGGRGRAVPERTPRYLPGEHGGRDRPDQGRHPRRPVLSRDDAVDRTPMVQHEPGADRRHPGAPGDQPGDGTRGTGHGAPRVSRSGASGRDLRPRLGPDERGAEHAVRHGAPVRGSPRRSPAAHRRCGPERKASPSNCCSRPAPAGSTNGPSPSSPTGCSASCP